MYSIHRAFAHFDNNKTFSSLKFIHKHRQIAFWERGKKLAVASAGFAFLSRLFLPSDTWA